MVQFSIQWNSVPAFEPSIVDLAVSWNTIYLSVWILKMLRCGYRKPKKFHKMSYRILRFRIKLMSKMKSKRVKSSKKAIALLDRLQVTFILLELALTRSNFDYFVCFLLLFCIETDGMRITFRSIHRSNQYYVYSHPVPTIQPTWSAKMNQSVWLI